MALKSLSQFNKFDLHEFLQDKRLFFVKAVQWTKTDKKIDQTDVLGSKVITQILEDNTQYLKSDMDNFGEQITIKVRNIAPSAFDKWTPLETEVFVCDVEHASIFGEYRNQLNIIASVSTKAPQ